MATSAPCTIKPGGLDVLLFNDQHFGALRKWADIPDDFINDGWNLQSLEDGSGKGGCMMTFLGSDYVVKEMAYEDHTSLLALAESYVEHVSSGETLLGAIFMHFEHIASRRRFYVMRNVLGRGPFLAMYDLKGCNDDKTLELFGEKINPPKWTAIMAASCSCVGSKSLQNARAAFGSGKRAASRADLIVTADQREDVVERLRRDTEWLATNDLMDYSLLVGVKTDALQREVSASDWVKTQLGRVPFERICSDGSTLVLCVGIIDFLQRWTSKKKIAQAVKVLERNKATIPPPAYAERFRRHFETRFTCASVANAAANQLKVQEHEEVVSL